MPGLRDYLYRTVVTLVDSVARVGVDMVMGVYAEGVFGVDNVDIDVLMRQCSRWRVAERVSRDLQHCRTTAVQ